MTKEVVEASEPSIQGVDRVLGRIRGPERGPTLLCIGGLHGNEPAGVRALEKVLVKLEPRGRLVSGEFVALAGNCAALAVGHRFMDRDLNRAWTPERIWRLCNRGAVRGEAEDREQIELLDAIEEVVETAREVTGHPIPAEIGPRRPGDPAALIASSDKIQRELGWKPQYPELRDIIETAWKWHQAHPKGYGD